MIHIIPIIPTTLLGPITFNSLSKLVILMPAYILNTIAVNKIMRKLKSCNNNPKHKYAKKFKSYKKTVYMKTFPN